MHRFISKGLGLFLAGLIVSTAAVSCGGDDDDAQSQPVTKAKPKTVTNLTVGLNASTAASGATAALNGLTFSVPSSVLAQNAQPAALAQALSSNSNTQISFSGVSGSTGNFTMKNPNLGGTLKIASCTFTVTTADDPALIGGVIYIADCDIKLNSSSTSTDQGTIQLVLNGNPSAPTAVTITVNGTTGVVTVNGTSTNVVITGATGG